MESARYLGSLMQVDQLRILVTHDPTQHYWQAGDFGSASVFVADLDSSPLQMVRRVQATTPRTAAVPGQDLLALGWRPGPQAGKLMSKIFPRL